MVAQHTPSEQDIMSGCTEWTYAGSYASTHAQQAVCDNMPLHFPATVLCKKDKARIGQCNMLHVRSQQQGSNFDWWQAERI